MSAKHRHQGQSRRSSTKETSRRQKRVASEVFEILSSAIVQQIADPRVQGISITHVEVSGDLHHARVYVTSSAENHNLEMALEGLKNAGGFLRNQLATRMTTKKVPDLQFFKDSVIYNAWQLEQVIDNMEETPNE